MRTKIKNVLLFQNDGTFLPGSLTVENDRIVTCGRADTVIDGQGALLCPGLIDQHTHGRAGADFCSATEKELAVMAADYAKHGVTTVLPTLASDTFEGWTEALSRIGKSGLAAFAGIHLEGRWLSPARRGARREARRRRGAAEGRGGPRRRDSGGFGGVLSTPGGPVGVGWRPGSFWVFRGRAPPRARPRT